MKITKKNILKSERIWKGTCRSCKSEAEAEEGELQITHDQREGSFSWMRCPVCDVGPYGGMLFYPPSK